MKKITNDTHTIEFTTKEGIKLKQGAIGKTDLMNIIREMLTDGATEIHIKTLK